MKSQLIGEKREKMNGGKMDIVSHSYEKCYRLYGMGRRKGESGSSPQNVPAQILIYT